MLGKHLLLVNRAQRAIKQLTGKVCACRPPMSYCAGGQVTAYRLQAVTPGVCAEQTFYFDASWQPLAGAPVGAAPCCNTKECGA